ncbi:hypothetical protein [Brevibacillus brevis]|uniref:hypothetical protein n=1 Tax=Brevibacillus brevis TaxID=1393 RepID=UPI0037CB0732
MRKWTDFAERNKRLNPLWKLGDGMALGELHSYRQPVCLGLLLQVFYRELESSDQRTQEDLVELAWDVLRDMGLEDEADQAIVERLVDGLLSSHNGGSFEGIYYDEEKQVIASHRFKYFRVDDEASHRMWEHNQKAVYKLSDQALELIFISHEIMKQFNVSIKLMEIEFHLKHGRLNRAIHDLQDLVGRVRRLIQQEKDYEKAMRRNPSSIFSQDRGSQLESIQRQFAEERKQIDGLLATLHRFEEEGQFQSEPEDFLRLYQNIDLTSRVHDELAQRVIRNIEMETNFRLNYPELFWKASHVTFRETIWEEWVMEKGIPDPDMFSWLVEGVFSPKQEFHFPFPWAWIEQETKEVLTEEVLIEEDEEVHLEPYHPRQVPWDEMVELWAPIFLTLATHREFHLRDAVFDESTIAKWIDLPEAVDIWMQFLHTRVRIEATIPNGVSDECIHLLSLAMKKYPELRVLQGKTIWGSIDTTEKMMIRWGNVMMSPFCLLILEEGGL